MRLTGILVSIALLTGCGGGPMGMGGGGDFAKQMEEMQRQSMAGQESMFAKQKLMQDLMNSPDIQAWHNQRDQMALAVGDRQFDKSFDVVFDAMTVALASLGCRVQNMERVSGYITASIPELPPEQLQSLQHEATRQYALAKGYPPNILDSKGPMDDMFDVEGATNMMSRGMSGLTLSMVKQSPEQTKVKLRFDNVYYPGLVSEYYKVVWASVDKQMFLDKALD